MSVNYNSQAMDYLNERLGKVLLMAAVAVQSEMKKSLNTPYPPASKPGEFPHYRTGNLRESIGIDPMTAKEAGRLQRIRIGYMSRAKYGAFLEVLHRRLGLKETVKRLRSFIQHLGLSASESK